MCMYTHMYIMYPPVDCVCVSAFEGTVIVQTRKRGINSLFVVRIDLEVYIGNHSK